MDKLAFLTGYQLGLNNAVGRIERSEREKLAIMVPEHKAYGYSPEAFDSYQYHKKKQSDKNKNVSTLAGLGTGMGVGALAGGKFGGGKGAILGALLGALPGATAGYGLGAEGIVGGDSDKGRPFADVVRSLKVRQQGGAPGTSFEEKYLKPLRGSRIA